METVVYLESYASLRSVGLIAMLFGTARDVGISLADGKTFQVFYAEPSSY